MLLFRQNISQINIPVASDPLKSIQFIYQPTKSPVFVALVLLNIETYITCPA